MTSFQLCNAAVSPVAIELCFKTQLSCKIVKTGYDVKLQYICDANVYYWNVSMR